MDLQNKALVDAFNKKYGMTAEQRKSVGITDEEYENTKKRFAEKFFAEQEGREAPKAALKGTTKATPKPSPTLKKSSVYKEFSKGWKERFGFPNKK